VKRSKMPKGSSLLLICLVDCVLLLVTSECVRQLQVKIICFFIVCVYCSVHARRREQGYPHVEGLGQVEIVFVNKVIMKNEYKSSLIRGATERT
jgi:hypothetical protein